MVRIAPWRNIKQTSVTKHTEIQGKLISIETFIQRISRFPTYSYKIGPRLAGRSRRAPSLGSLQTLPGRQELFTFILTLLGHDTFIRISIKILAQPKSVNSFFYAYPISKNSTKPTQGLKSPSTGFLESNLEFWLVNASPETNAH